MRNFCSQNGGRRLGVHSLCFEESRPLRGTLREHPWPTVSSTGYKSGPCSTYTFLAVWPIWQTTESPTSIATPSKAGYLKAVWPGFGGCIVEVWPAPGAREGPQKRTPEVRPACLQVPSQKDPRALHRHYRGPDIFIITFFVEGVLGGTVLSYFFTFVT